MTRDEEQEGSMPEEVGPSADATKAALQDAAGTPESAGDGVPMDGDISSADSDEFHDAQAEVDESESITLASERSAEEPALGVNAAMIADLGDVKHIHPLTEGAVETHELDNDNLEETSMQQGVDISDDRDGNMANAVSLDPPVQQQEEDKDGGDDTATGVPEEFLEATPSDEEEDEQLHMPVRHEALDDELDASWLQEDDAEGEATRYREAGGVLCTPEDVAGGASTPSQGLGSFIPFPDAAAKDDNPERDTLPAYLSKANDGESGTDESVSYGLGEGYPEAQDTSACQQEEGDPESTGEGGLPVHLHQPDFSSEGSSSADVHGTLMVNDMLGDRAVQALLPSVAIKDSLGDLFSGSEEEEEEEDVRQGGGTGSVVEEYFDKPTERANQTLDADTQVELETGDNGLSRGPIPALVVPGPVSRAESTLSDCTMSPNASLDIETDAGWQEKERHFFVLSNAGKPVFSRYGNESSLAGFMGVICGMMSFMEASGDEVQSMRAGEHRFVFLCRGPLYLVAISRTGDPVKCLLLQLDLLYCTIISILTKAVERIFARSPSYDMRQLMGGTGNTMRALIRSFNRDPAAMMVAIPVVPLPPLQRRAAMESLASACNPSDGGAMYAALFCGDRCAAIAEPKAAPLHPHDILLLGNFVRSNDSFRQAESFAPVCLPHFNSTAYLHAYIHYVGQDSVLVLLASAPDTFPKLAEARNHIEATLLSAGVMKSLQDLTEGSNKDWPQIDQIPSSAGGGALGTTPLWHFVYRAPGKRQMLMAGFAGPLAESAARKATVLQYSALAAQMHDSKGAITQRTYFSSSDERVTIAQLQSDCEIYAIFDPLTEKSVAAQICNRLVLWIKNKYTQIFMPLGAS